jgi:uncharacterized membrane protein YphA (DoxX/SURF4 family)
MKTRSLPDRFPRPEEWDVKAWSLFLLRVSTGLLLVFWGLDKLVNVEHSLRVAERFYLGVGATTWFLNAFGVIEILLGILVVVGIWRRFTYPAMLAILTVSGLSVWKSIVDPWGWVFEGTNALFYPSLIIFAGALVLWGFREQDKIALDGDE